jgi:hypothetical protein
MRSVFGKGGQASPQGDEIRRFSPKMLEKEEKNIDIVSVGTPDHIHAPASLSGDEDGKALLLPKAANRHNVIEVRSVAKMTTEKKLVTQMGTQMHASEHFHQAVRRSSRPVLLGRFMRWWRGLIIRGHFRHEPHQGRFPCSKESELGPAAGTSAPPGLLRRCVPQSRPIARRWWSFGAGFAGRYRVPLAGLALGRWACDIRCAVAA